MYWDTGKTLNDRSMEGNWLRDRQNPGLTNYKLVRISRRRKATRLLASPEVPVTQLPLPPNLHFDSVVLKWLNIHSTDPLKYRREV
jgi:hypothetical protein